MNGLASRLFALYALGSILLLPLLVVAWFLFLKKKREPEPKVEVSVTVVKRSVFISTCSPSAPGTRPKSSPDL